MENEKPKRFERRPNFDMQAKLSRDGRYWIFTRTETWILPRGYLDAIIRNHTQEPARIEAIETDGATSKKRKRNADGNG